MRFRANDLELAMADGFDLMDILDMDDIVLSQAAAELEEEYMEDVLLCQAGDSPAVDVARFDENYVAHDTFETDFDILQDVSFELGLFLEENLQHWVNTDNQHMSEKAKIEYDDRFVPPVSEKEIEELVSAQTNANTKKNTRWSVGVFNEWRSAES
ncbi:unnamed protein product [Mytilus coruscus]|uniref:Uncharacterized protein n=1 Tax=Mytilus coruscus TaxID=42192 RepID=A0A6J8B270_MYTCO|nr:unnamed protein product [Mytilus coruscus]